MTGYDKEAMEAGHKKMEEAMFYASYDDIPDTAVYFEIEFPYTISRAFRSMRAVVEYVDNEMLDGCIVVATQQVDGKCRQWFEFELGPVQNLYAYQD